MTFSHPRLVPPPPAIAESPLRRLTTGTQWTARLAAQPGAAGYSFCGGGGLVVGLGAAYFYAVVRPVSGPGQRTDKRVAIALWVIVDLMPEMGQGFMGIFTM